MGRQLALAATALDELELLRFIESVVPIRVFAPFARSVDELWIRDWETREIQASGFGIWPQTFSWSPKYAQTGGPKCPPERVGLFYIANVNAAPVFEVTRSSLDHGRFGRIYWARDFSASRGLDYDAAAFARLTDAVWRWMRKVGHRAPGAATHSPYFLPDAWSHYANVAA